MTASNQPPLIAHVLFRLSVGGLENGVVNLINRIPPERYRHAVVCLTDYTDFAKRIQRDDVEIIALHKKEGQDFGLYWRLLQTFRRLKPAIVHSRNLAALEAQLPALLAGVPGRVHGEHGWDVSDPKGQVRKYQLLRRAFIPLVKAYIPLSRELEAYLLDPVGVPLRKLNRIYNGVDNDRFSPQPGHAALPPGFANADSIVIGTVGRMHGVKDQLNLAQAFVKLCQQQPETAAQLRLVFVGDGPLREECRQLLQDNHLESQAWLPGSRDDVPRLMQAMDVFVLPSLAEGISNTILEAMSCGLPVVATDVGGNAELVVAGETGRIVPSADPQALANALAEYVCNPDLIQQHGEAGRVRIEQHFSMQAMVDAYMGVYDKVLAS
ncbi:MAG: TIGR03088 family PEP-CTERM/XrtA system glycosyltransferase [Chromatiales bacterium]